MKVYVLHSDSLDAYDNLSYENALFRHISALTEKGDEAYALFLWRNDKTVVIGRHQNPYKECNLEYMKNHGIKLARRTTGGGAVYHDKGNLNFTFIASCTKYDKQKNLDIVLKALNSLGISASLSGRNDILLNDKKISGNAFKNVRFASLHHGTILINLANEDAENSLTPDKYKLAKKGVDSVKSRIINLKEIDKDIDYLKVSAALENSLLSSFRSNEKIFELPLPTKDLYEKYTSNAWLFGDYKADDYTVSGNFEWGSIGMDISVKDGKIEKIKIATDSLETELFEEIETVLTGVMFTTEDLNYSLMVFPSDIRSDIMKLLLECKGEE